MRKGVITFLIGRFPSVPVVVLAVAVTVCPTNISIAALILVYFLVIPGPARILHRLLCLSAHRVVPAQRPDIVLVPVAGSIRAPSGRWMPTTETSARISGGEAIAIRHNVPLFVAGGWLDEETTEASIALSSSPTDSLCEVIHSSDAPSTSATADRVAEIAIARAYSRVAVVSQPTHFARIAASLRAKGLSVVGMIVPPDQAGWRGWTDLVPSTGATLLYHRAIYECAAILIYLAQGKFRLSHLRDSK